jgi:hypothetical protein
MIVSGLTLWAKQRVLLIDRDSQYNARRLFGSRKGPLAASLPPDVIPL